MGGHFDLTKTRGKYPQEAMEDVLNSGAVILAHKQLVLYSYLDFKDFGYPTTIATEDVAGVIKAIIKVTFIFYLKCI